MRGKLERLQNNLKIEEGVGRKKEFVDIHVNSAAQWYTAPGEPWLPGGSLVAAPVSDRRRSVHGRVACSR